MTGARDGAATEMYDRVVGRTIESQHQPRSRVWFLQNIGGTAVTNRTTRGWHCNSGNDCPGHATERADLRRGDW